VGDHPAAPRAGARGGVGEVGGGASRRRQLKGSSVKKMK
jgi:hypothetical protein